MSSKNRTQAPVDNNANLKVGTIINGVFTHKLEFGMVVGFKVDGKHCTGVLPIERFPSNDPAMRAKMLQVAEVGMPAPGLTVISIKPPKEGKRFSRVRLSARTTQPDSNKAIKKTPRSVATDVETVPGGDSVSSVAHNRAAGSMPSQTGTVSAVPGIIEPVQMTTVILPPADPVARAKELLLEARQPARSCGLADLGRALKINRAGDNAMAMGYLISLEAHLNQIGDYETEAAQLKSSLSADVLTRATTLHDVRAEKSELDAQTALLRQESARYAGLCGKIKRAGANVPTELQSQADEMKAAIEAKRASLKEALAANKKADDDADLDLLFSMSSQSDYKAAMEEAVAIAGKMKNATSMRDWYVNDLARLIVAYETHMATLG